MAFAGGSVTVKRFYVAGSPIRQPGEELLEQLARHAIGRDCIQTGDYAEIGWVSGDHILDTRFDFAKNAVADGLHFALRIDTNRPPTDLVRSYQRESEQAMLEASGRDFLSRAERREAREQAKARADAEARGGAFRRMKQIPVFWDCERGQAYLGAAGSAVADAFMLLFHRTFDRALTPAGSGEAAARWASEAGESRAFDDCHLSHFVTPPDMGDTETPASKLDAARSRDYLGTEFLTWLWYTSHVESPSIATPAGQTITVLFEKGLQMTCAFGLTGTTTISADGPTHLAEATVSLAEGKLPVRAGLQVAVQGDVFSLAVRGDVMHYSGIVLPPVEDADSGRAVFEERIGHLRDLLDAMDGLYAAFLRRRLSSRWPQTLNVIRNWIASGRFDTSRAEPSAMVAS
jgi:hypothetical protein